MNAELLRFFATAGLFLVVMIVLRRRNVARTPAKPDRAAPESVVPAGSADVHSTHHPARSADVQSTHHPALDRVAGQAVLLRRHVPSRAGALSFWGGLPLVPADFEWPHFTPEGGSPRALSFLLQIDCAAIADDARLGLMPERGLLYFFLDLDWGVHWKWRVLYLDADPAALAPARLPAALPHAYGHRDYWEWPQRDEDWPKLLPRMGFDPIAIHGSSLPPFHDDDDDDRFVWPGSIDVAEALKGVEGAIVDSCYIRSRYEDGILQRPYPCFPQDWQAVRIALGHLACQSRRGHLERMASRPESAQQAEALRSALAEGLAVWGARADAADSSAALDPSVREDFWGFFVSVQPVSLFALSEAAAQSLDATIAAAMAPGTVLDDDAMAFARCRHALGSRDDQNRVHISAPNRMLSAPTDVQGDAAERARQWLMLLELSSDPAIGHHFAEGVLQFYIRPEDLAARRFDRVDLYATAY